MTTTTDRLDRLVNELFRKFEEMCKQRFEQETHKSQTDDTADWQQKYYQEQVAYYEKLAQERKEREKEWEEKSAALEREARWYPLGCLFHHLVCSSCFDCEALFF